MGISSQIGRPYLRSMSIILLVTKETSGHGPIPVGHYSIGPTTRPGGAKRRLMPNPVPRYDFELHGCSNPQICSDGCIAATTNATRDHLNSDLNLEEGRNTLEVIP